MYQPRQPIRHKLLKNLKTSQCFRFNQKSTLVVLQEITQTFLRRYHCPTSTLDALRMQRNTIPEPYNIERLHA
jgi:hypothetical protein